MALPLILKAAALGGAAYVASRWLSAQNRQRRVQRATTSSSTAPNEAGDNQPASSPYAARENYPEASRSPTVDLGPTS